MNAGYVEVTDLHAHEKLRHYTKLQRLRGRMLKTIRRRITGTARDWKDEFLTCVAWPDHLRPYLESIPSTFFTSYSADPHACNLLLQFLLAESPRMMIECGCGISTIILGLTVRHHDLDTAIYSLEQDEKWLEATSEAMAPEVRERVHLLHAPVRAYPVGDARCQCYDLSVLPDVQAGLVFIDGPSPIYGRAGVLPVLQAQNKLTGSCVIFLDDARRDREYEYVQQWVHDGQAAFQKYHVTDCGLAELVTP